ncbi:phage portal protein [Ruminiclostridium papyrosolvens]|uniref:Portal protein n=1 Tax=Ruminiclostridium papyrosolvens C7 TaxID=1330534 RepID=U4R2S5_9FIRM|nr:phage portal protein [Ruminiclostridium papyrosolvens]EPR12491.1 hypothetical protein L323_08025 [Ruminiclostridium papyrosolvens C7]
MSIFSRFTNKSPQTTRYEMVTETGNGFYMWNGKLFQSDIVRSCIRPKTKAIGKLVAKHIRTDKTGIQVNPDAYLRFLLEEPNPYMTGQVMQEKLATQLALNNNAFAVIIRDEFGYPVEIYPIPATTVEAIYDNTANLFLKFYFKNGNRSIFPYSDIIHLRQDFNDNDIFGESPAAALTSLMDIINTTDQGIIKAVKNGAVIKWLLKFSSSLRPEDLKKNAQDFVDNYLSIESTTMGVGAVDSKADIQRVEPKDYVPNAMIVDKVTQRVYSFFNTNEKIVQSKFSEDEWNAYYESEIEPLALQLSGEYTRKIFSRRERGFGNKIYFEASNLQWASLKTKLELLQMVDRGALTPNEWRETMSLAPLQGGNDPVRRLDTAVVNEIKTLLNKMNGNEKDIINTIKSLIGIARKGV